MPSTSSSTWDKAGWHTSRNGPVTLRRGSFEDIDDASTTAFNTKVETNKGAVTLYGKAKNAAEKDLATKLANDINGVKSVTNRMTIE